MQIIKWLVVLSLGFLIGLVIWHPKSATNQYERPNENPIELQKTPKVDEVQPKPKEKSVAKNKTPLKSPKGDPEKIKKYLESVKSRGIVGSPLAPYSHLIANSDFWAVIIGICTIEQYNCTSAPNFNFWGMGPGKRYASAEESIADIDRFLTKAYNNGRTTVESLRGWYCQSACTNWYPTVIKIKTLLETN